MARDSSARLVSVALITRSRVRPPQIWSLGASPGAGRSITVDDEIVGGPSSGTTTLKGVALSSWQVRMWGSPSSDDVPIGRRSKDRRRTRATGACSAEGLADVRAEKHKCENQTKTRTSC